MGHGESYAEEFDDWLARQPMDMLEAYQGKHRAPLEWAEIRPVHEA